MAQPHFFTFRDCVYIETDISDHIVTYIIPIKSLATMFCWCLGVKTDISDYKASYNITIKSLALSLYSETKV